MRSRLPWDAGTAAAVAIHDLRVVRDGGEVLRGISATVGRGQVVGLVGPSGCGKTTLMRCVLGVQRTAGGDVNVLGLPAGHPRLRHRLGYRTQSPSVYDDLTVDENLWYFASIIGAPRSDVDRVVAEVDLGTCRRRAVHSLSGGEQARVSLAVALLGDPELLVLDEPTVGLDPVLRVDLWALFHRLAAVGRTLLVSSHVMEEAARCDSLLLMRDGKLLASLTPAELREHTGRSDLEAAFLDLVRSATVAGHGRHERVRESSA